MSVKTVFCALMSRKSGYDDVAYWSPSPLLVKTSTSEPGSLTGIGRNRTASTSENIAVLAPIPSPRERIATAAKPGLRRSQRQAYLKSDHILQSTGCTGRTGGDLVH